MYDQHRKKAYVNGAIIALNAIYFLYLELVGSSENTLFMLRHGAMMAPLVVEQGQYYRLLTAVFMHFGTSHIVNNMLVLFVLGDNLERALGHVKYLIFYLICGVGANLISMSYHLKTNPLVVSAGASGAVFGVIGGLVWVVLRNKGRLEDLSSTQLYIFIGFSLYHGLMSANIDNAAHIGGLVIGFVVSLLLYRKPARNRPSPYWEIKE